MAETTEKSLIEKLGEHLVQSRPAAARRYFELLMDNVGDEQQIEEIKAAMAALGKTVEDLAVDRAVLTRAAELALAVQSGSNLTAELEAAQNAAGESQKRTDEHVEKLRRAQQALVDRATAINTHQQQARNAAAELKRLREENPELLSFYPAVEFKA